MIITIFTVRIQVHKLKPTVDPQVGPQKSGLIMFSIAGHSSSSLLIYKGSEMDCKLLGQILV